MTTSCATGWDLLETGHTDQARAFAEMELAREPRALEPAALRIMCDWRSGMALPPLISRMRSIAAKAPDVALYQRCVGMLLVSRGDIAAARETLRKAIELEPENADGIRSYADLEKVEPDDPVLSLALRLYAGKSIAGEAASVLGFALAKMLDDIGEYDKAMSVLVEANAQSDRPYDVAAEARELGDLFGLLPCGPLPADGGCDSDLPIFIVGMPRSGTTLIESAFGRHSHVYPAGEWTLIDRAENEILDWMQSACGYDGTRARLAWETPPDVIEKTAAELLRIMQSDLQHSATRFVDKMPHDVLRLGLIARLFPGARIVYVRRHPLDACVSNFFARFNMGHPHAFDLGALGAHYRYVAETAAAWRQVIANPILDVSYEVFVEDTELQIRRLVAFAGLDWEEACLSPEKARTSVFTASMAQVRQPVHTRSRERWRRYERWLAPTIEAMGGMDWIEAEHMQARDAGSA